MKKIIVLCVALLMVLSMSSAAMAGYKPPKRDKKTNTISANVAGVYQDGKIINKAEAKTGDAVAVGNVSYTAIKSSSEAENKYTLGGKADSDSYVCVDNHGTAIAYSGDAEAKNTGDNKITTDVDQENK